MASKAETFGLVYVDIKRLPYSLYRKQRDSGFYDEKIGEKIHHHTVAGIENRLELMIENIGQYEIPIDKVRANRGWGNIAEKYEKINKQIG